MIIGLAGYARAGKDTVANILVEEAGFVRVAFADALKRVAYDIAPGTARSVDVHGWEAVKADPGVRELLQNLGVACRNHIHPNVWVNAVFNHVEPGRRYVISDVRFPNELAAVRSHNGEVWRIERPGTAPVNGHVSETAIDGETYDRFIYNDGTLADLRLEVLSRLEAP